MFVNDMPFSQEYQLEKFKSSSDNPIFNFHHGNIQLSSKTHYVRDGQNVPALLNGMSDEKTIRTKRITPSVELVVDAFICIQ